MNIKILHSLSFLEPTQDDIDDAIMLHTQLAGQAWHLRYTFQHTVLNLMLAGF